uniref:G-protein coupled receptors family 3 profile domain-containing protein n=1 Tax=Oryzias latipes TaxID=8090 RepID=A0A3P9HPP3_ORYLA
MAPCLFLPLSGRKSYPRDTPLWCPVTAASREPSISSVEDSSGLLWKRMSESFYVLFLVTFSINARELRFSRTMIFAIEEINNSTELLPGIRLGYQIHDSCAAVPMAVQAAFQLSNGGDKVFYKDSNCSQSGMMAAVVAESGSTPSISISRIIGPFNIPQVNTSFNFYKLVKHFGWTWIGAICSDSDYGNNGMASFLQAAQKEGICVEFSESFHRTQSTAKVIVAFAGFGEMKFLLEELAAKPTPSLQWVGSEAWITDTNLQKFTFCEGAIGFAIPKSDIPGLRNFLLDLSPSEVAASPLLTEFWEETFKCKLRKDFNFFRQFFLSCFYLQVLDALKKVNFTQNGYPVSFEENGDPVAVYELVNWQKGQSGNIELVTVGYYDASLPINREFHFDKNLTWMDDSSDCFPCPIEFWPNPEKDSCHPKPVEYLSIDETLAIILAAVSVGGACLAILTAAVFFHHRTTPIVRANNSELSFLLLFSLTLCFLCSLTFIGAPTEWSCMLRHSAFGITFVLCISCVLGKTIVVLMAFKATLPGSNVMKWFGPLQQRLTVVFLTFVQVLICIIWLVLRPPFPMKNFITYKERIILECALGSAIGFWAVLGYIGLLAVFCFVLAVLARKLPDNFNEAKLITFSMLIFCAVWLSFVPAYVSSPGKFTVAVEIFAILASSFGLIMCIFAPKCFVILFQPEKNTKKCLRNKN